MNNKEGPRPNAGIDIPTFDAGMQVNKGRQNDARGARPRKGGEEKG
jgi:hypothetical protein